jgi:hypothetical protein
MGCRCQKFFCSDHAVEVDTIQKKSDTLNTSWSFRAAVKRMRAKQKQKNKKEKMAGPETFTPFSLV